MRFSMMGINNPEQQILGLKNSDFDLNHLQPQLQKFITVEPSYVEYQEVKQASLIN